jgi:glutamate synthase (NADPH/NADH) small chain
MGDLRGFLKLSRRAAQYRSVCARIKDFAEVQRLAAPDETQEQASRCMDCGTPFCQWGCPIGNYIPEWNDLAFRGHWQRAWELLQATNNFPEITGRICPASCEYACVLGINDEAVTIRENELAIIEYAFSHGLVKAQPPKGRSGRQVAIVGSGPAGLSCADQLNKAGHLVVVFEKADKIGGILRYGIPDFKLDKLVLERRLRLLREEGVIFNAGVEIGKGIKLADLQKQFDAVCLAMGSSAARDLKIKGRDLVGIHLAMDYLGQMNRRAAGEKTASADLIDAKNKRVVVIGGGDTGADCVGVALRQGAACVTQIELLPQPPACRSPQDPWPKYPLLLKTSSSHEEGCTRQWSILTREFLGRNGKVEALSCARAEMHKDAQGCPSIQEIPGTEFQIGADLVILALGFLPPRKEDLPQERGVFCCGDMRRGASLAVWAIAEGRNAALGIDKYLELI